MLSDLRIVKVLVIRFGGRRAPDVDPLTDSQGKVPAGWTISCLSYMARNPNL